MPKARIGAYFLALRALSSTAAATLSVWQPGTNSGARCVSVLLTGSNSASWQFWLKNMPGCLYNSLYIEIHTQKQYES